MDDSGNAISKPDFLEEIGARWFGLGNLVCLSVALGSMLAIFFLLLPLPGGWNVKWLVWVWLGFSGLFVGFLITTFGPLLLWGGTYRVIVQEGRLRVESPHQTFGPSFDVQLTEIERLVFREVSDAANRYEVHTRSGELFEVNGACAVLVFEAVQRLHPEIPRETRQELE